MFYKLRKAVIFFILSGAIFPLGCTESTTEKVQYWDDGSKFEKDFPTTTRAWDWDRRIDEENDPFLRPDSYRIGFFIVLVFGFIIVITLIIYCRQQRDFSTSVQTPTTRHPQAYSNPIVLTTEQLDSLPSDPPPDYTTVTQNDHRQGKGFQMVVKSPNETPPPKYEQEFPFKLN